MRADPSGRRPSPKHPLDLTVARVGARHNQPFLRRREPATFQLEEKTMFSQEARGWLSRIGLFTAVLAVMLIVLFSISLINPTPAVAGGANCFELMEPGARPQDINFATAVYTLSVPSDSDVCVESTLDLLVGFTSTKPFAVNGEGADGSPFLWAEGPVQGTLVYDLAATGGGVKIELTDTAAVAAVNDHPIVWFGSLVANLVTPTPAPVATTRNLVVVGSGTLLKGRAPEWDTRPLTGTLDLEIQAGVRFTGTTTTGAASGGTAEYPAVSCGDGCWTATTPTNEGVISAPELKGWWWKATLIGDGMVLMPDPNAASTPASTTSTTAPDSGGGGGDEAPKFWRPSSRPAVPVYRSRPPTWALQG